MYKEYGNDHIDHILRNQFSHWADFVVIFQRQLLIYWPFVTRKSSGCSWFPLICEFILLNNFFCDFWKVSFISMKKISWESLRSHI